MNALIIYDVRQSSHVSISSSSKPFPWVEELPLTSSIVFNCSDIGLPARLPNALGTVSNAFTTPNRYSCNLEWSEWSIQLSQAAYFFIFARQETILFRLTDWRTWTQFIFMKWQLTLKSSISKSHRQQQAVFPQLKHSLIIFFAATFQNPSEIPSEISFS